MKDYRKVKSHWIIVVNVVVNDFSLFWGGITICETTQLQPPWDRSKSLEICLYLYLYYIYTVLEYGCLWKFDNAPPEWQLWLGTWCGQFGVSYFQTSPYRLEVPWFLASYFPTVRSWERELRPIFGPWGFLWSLTGGSRPFTQSFQGLTPGAFEGPPDDGFLVLRQLQHRHDRLPGWWSLQ